MIKAGLLLRNDVIKLIGVGVLLLISSLKVGPENDALLTLSGIVLLLGVLVLVLVVVLLLVMEPKLGDLIVSLIGLLLLRLSDDDDDDDDD